MENDEKNFLHVEEIGDKVMIDGKEVIASQPIIIQVKNNTSEKQSVNLFDCNDLFTHFVNKKVTITSSYHADGADGDMLSYNEILKALLVSGSCSPEIKIKQTRLCDVSKNVGWRWELADEEKPNDKNELLHAPILSMVHKNIFGTIVRSPIRFSDTSVFPKENKVLIINSSFKLGPMTKIVLDNMAPFAHYHIYLFPAKKD